ncbi:MAG: hypothetical protein J0L93_03475 [Deltaproteobacteria bacterium]|nr:hypothetical protein [Deltaproteobacteria bacterium]
MKSAVFFVLSFISLNLDLCFAQDFSGFENPESLFNTGRPVEPQWQWREPEPTELAPAVISHTPWQDVLIIRAAFLALDKQDPNSARKVSYLESALKDIFGKRFYALKTSISFQKPAEKFTGQPFKVSIGGVRGSSFGPQILMSFGGDGALLSIQRINHPPSSLAPNGRKPFHYAHSVNGLGANFILKEYLFPMVVKQEFRSGLPVDFQETSAARESLLKAHRESFGLIGIKRVYDPESETPHQLNFILGSAKADAPGMFVQQLASIALQRSNPIEPPKRGGCYKIIAHLFESVRFF